MMKEKKNNVAALLAELQRPDSQRTINAPSRAQTTEEAIAEGERLLADVDALFETHDRVMAEFDANPMEDQGEIIDQEAGAKLQQLDEEDIAATRDLQAFFDEDEQSQKEEERLETTGKPPPLYPVK